jgi:hypothetical protein
MKIVRKTFGAQFRRVDSLSRYARFQKLAPIVGGEIDMGSAYNAKFRGHFGAYLKTALADAGADGGVQIGRLGAETLAHRFHGAAGNRGGRPTPTRVYGGYCVEAFIAEQNRNAVGRFNSDYCPRRIFQQRIALADYAGAATSRQAGGRMNLLQRGEMGEQGGDIGVARTKSVN